MVGRGVVQTAKLQVVRRSAFTATPWKNGGGITHEALRMPASGEPFRWRVSVAHIDASGPFSDFAAYNRKMVLLRGAGIDLRFGDGTHKTLRQVGELVEFDGALSTYCELLKGPCVDLNLMVSKSEKAAARVEPLMDSLTVSASGAETTLIFSIDRGLTLEIAGAKSEALEPWDLAVLSHGTGQLRPLAPAGVSPTLVFLATLAG
jgi:uncharacterized protein